MKVDTDPASTRTTGEATRSGRTTFTSSTEVRISTPDAPATRAEVAFQVDMPKDAATPAAMRAVNPFDPASIPPGTTVRLDGADYVGTPFEAGFREIAAINDTRIEQLAITIGRTKDGELRVASADAAVFDAPKVAGPASQPLDRDDFALHKVLFDDADAPGTVAAVNAFLTTGALPDGTVGVREEVAVGAVNATIADIASGEANEVMWTFDERGRPTGAEATLTWEPSSADRDHDRIEANAQSQFRTDHGLAGTADHTGHMLAYRFVAGHGSVNMFPQEGSFNTGTYARIEQEWSDWLAEGMDVRISIDLGPGGQQRPDTVAVDYEVIDPASGKVVYDPALTVFDNAAGQVYDTIRRNEMDDLIAAAA
ncbi:MAG TPA: DNA/RNA non-specific endonuclease [Luteimonas sp.]|nr:DNA/RNA non-specific endonuclease [Luteimonas sp.]